MVAQQILVLFVKVRVLMRQQREERELLFFCICLGDMLILHLDSEEGRMCMNCDFDLVCKMVSKTICQAGVLYENIG